MYIGEKIESFGFSDYEVYGVLDVDADLLLGIDDDNHCVYANDERIVTTDEDALVMTRNREERDSVHVLGYVGEEQVLDMISLLKEEYAEDRKRLDLDDFAFPRTLETMIEDIRLKYRWTSNILCWTGEIPSGWHF